MRLHVTAKIMLHDFSNEQFSKMLNFVNIQKRIPKT